MGQRQDTLRVASYNIRKCIGLDRRRDPERVLSVLAELDADVIALQEADRRLGPRPSALPKDRIPLVTGLSAVPFEEGSVSLGWHGNAILLRDDLTIEVADMLDLPSLEPRGAVLNEFSSSRGDLRVVGVHLGLTRSHRRAQWEEIREVLDKRAEMPTVVLGDYNEWREDRGLEPLEDDFTIHSPGLSFHSARPVASLDRIALTRELELQDAGVHERGEALRASDHLPIWADLKVG